MTKRTSKKSRVAKITRVWGRGRDKLWSYGETVSIPETFDFIASGDPYVTRAVKSRCREIFEVVEKDRSFSRTLGFWLPKESLQTILQDQVKTQQARQARRIQSAQSRQRREEKFQEKAVQVLQDLFPSMDPRDAVQIVRRAFEVGSGRVGRSGHLDLEEKLHAATIAHVRHNYTDYDEILEYGDRDEARESVAPKIKEIVEAWKKPLS